jgi:hypothetical protein
MRSHTEQAIQGETTAKTRLERPRAYDAEERLTNEKGMLDAERGKNARGVEGRSHKGTKREAAMERWVGKGH